MDLYGRGKSRIAFALHNLIPTRQQGVCSPIRPSTKPSQWASLPLRSTCENESERNMSDSKQL